MLTKNIFFQNFKVKNLKIKFKKNFISSIKKEIKNEKNLLFSFTNKYQQSYSRSYLIKLKKKFPIINVIGMGGSILGSKAIYYFLKERLFHLKYTICLVNKFFPVKFLKKKNN